MQQNYMNTNEVFPILDLIGLAMNKRYGKPNFDEISGGDVSGGASFQLPMDLRVTSLRVDRDVTNPVMPTVVKVMNITYENGATAVLTIHRGADPKVPVGTSQEDYFNFVMIRGLHMLTSYQGQTEEMDVKILKVDGYKEMIGLDIAWNGGLYETIDIGGGEEPIVDPDPNDTDLEMDVDGGNDDFGIDLEYENPNDFFTGEGQGDVIAK